MAKIFDNDPDELDPDWDDDGDWRREFERMLQQMDEDEKLANEDIKPWNIEV